MADEPPRRQRRASSGKVPAKRANVANSGAANASHMHAPPLQVTPEGIEPHAHRTGHIRADRIIAGAAILMSLLSLLIAYKHGLIMRDLVSANSWPLLQYDSNNVDEQTKTWFIRMSVVNAGVGPAVVRSYAFIYNGKRYTHGEALLKDCCGYTFAKSADEITGAITRPVENTVIQAGETRNFLTYERTPQNIEVFQKLDRVRFKLGFEACYCSVLGDCWRSDLVGVEPKKVDSCPPPERATQG